MARAKQIAREKIKAEFNLTDEALKQWEDAYDGDLSEVTSQLTAAQESLSKWNKWAKEEWPQIQTALQEKELMAQKLAALEKAGFKLGDPNPEPDKNKRQSAEPFDEEKFKAEIYYTTSQVMKELNTASLQIFKDFGEVLDVDSVEKVVHEKGLRVKDVVAEMYKEKYATKQKEAEEKRINAAVEERVNAELSKRTMPPNLRPREESIVSMLQKEDDKKGPSDRENFELFIKDMRESATAH